jgi:hypothetical protein
MQNAKSGTAERDWEVKLEGGKSAGEVVVALISLQDKKLTFQWTAEAAAEPAALYLKNCSLTMYLNQDKHDVLLRQPIDVPPITLNLDKAIAPAKLNLEAPPNPEQLLIEFTAIEGGLPKFSLDPPQPMKVQGGSQWIRFGENINEQMLSIQVESKLARVIELRFTPNIKLPTEPKPEKFSVKTLAKHKSNIAVLKTNVSQELSFLEAAARNDRQEFARRGLAARQNLLQQEMTKLTQAEQQITQLEQLLDKTGTVQFRVFYDTGSAQVELMRSKAGVE